MISCQRALKVRTEDPHREQQEQRGGEGTLSCRLPPMQPHQAARTLGGLVGTQKGQGPSRGRAALAAGIAEPAGQATAGSASCLHNDGFSLDPGDPLGKVKIQRKALAACQD